MKVFLAFFIFSIIYFFYQPIIAQTIDFNNYTFLKSMGQIPAEIQTSEYKIYQTSIAEFQGKDLPDKSHKSFYLKSKMMLCDLFNSGRVLFGDPVSEYVNKVADEVQKNNSENLKKVKVFVLKSSSVNAFCSPEGYVFINIGLISKLKSEAELAFVICHEISHFNEKDGLKSYLENLNIVKGKGKYFGLRFDDKLDLISQNSRESELKADSLGAVLYLKSRYAPAAMLSSMDMLHYNYLPFREIPFNKSFFNGVNYSIPLSLFLDSVKPISRVEDYRDNDHTHPNIFKRKNQIQKVSESLLKGDLYVISETRFNYIREICQFEKIRLDLSNHAFGDAIYNSYVLLQQRPESFYLKFCIAQALYGLVKYKNADQYSKVARSYTKTEGESQQIHSLLRQMTKKQLNSLALHYTRALRKTNAGDKILDKIESDLIDELVVNCKIDLSFLKKNAGTGNDVDFWFNTFDLTDLESPDVKNKFDAASGKAATDISAAKVERKENMKNTTIFIDTYIDKDNIRDIADLEDYETDKSRLMNAIQSLSINNNKVVSTSLFEIDPADIDKYNIYCLFKEILDEYFLLEKDIILIPLGIPDGDYLNDNYILKRFALIYDQNKWQLFEISTNLTNLSEVTFHKTTFKTINEKHIKTYLINNLN